MNIGIGVIMEANSLELCECDKRDSNLTTISRHRRAQRDNSQSAGCRLTRISLPVEKIKTEKGKEKHRRAKCALYVRLHFFLMSFSVG